MDFLYQGSATPSDVDPAGISFQKLWVDNLASIINSCSESGGEVQETGPTVQYILHSFEASQSLHIVPRVWSWKACLDKLASAFRWPIVGALERHWLSLLSVRLGVAFMQP